MKTNPGFYDDAMASTYCQVLFKRGSQTKMSDDNNFFGLTDDEYQILLEDIDQAVEEGNRKYGYGYGYGYGENIKSNSN